MSADVAVFTGFDDFADDLRQIEGEWRISHVMLARVMKVARSQIAADLVKRHLKWLNEISRVRTIRTRPENGGHEWDLHWLDKPQCIYLLAKSDMPEANDLTVHVVKVFDRVTRGELSTAPRMEIRALEVAAQQIVAPILAEQREFHREVLTRMDRTEGRVDAIAADLIQVKEASARFMDKPFSVKTRHLHASVVEAHYNSNCPCCRSVKIVAAGEKLSNCNDEHFHGRQQNGKQYTWLTCAECNQKLKNPDFRMQKSSAFQAYQDALRAHEGHAVKQYGFSF